MRRLALRSADGWGERRERTRKAHEIDDSRQESYARTRREQQDLGLWGAEAGGGAVNKKKAAFERTNDISSPGARSFTKKWRLPRSSQGGGDVQATRHQRGEEVSCLPRKNASKKRLKLAKKKKGGRKKSFSLEGGVP